MSAHDRKRLDEAIKKLSEAGGGLSLDDFRASQQMASKATARTIKVIVVSAGVVFLFLSFCDLIVAPYQKNTELKFLFSGIWAVSLGGLGAISSIFLDILKLIPQQTLRNNDQFEVVGRIMLGILFAFVLTLAISDEVPKFFSAMQKSSEPVDSLARGSVNNVMLLLPFIAGYSLPLVLGLLEKTIKAIELTIGLEDRRVDTTQDKGKITRRTR